MEWAIRIIEALAALMAVGILLVIFRQLRGPKPELPRGFLTRTVALELAESPEVAKAILGQPSSNVRKKVRGEVKGDFVFIAAYWLLFITLGALLVQSGFLGALLAATVAICITAAAQMDFLENLRLYTLLDTPSNTPEIEVQRRIDDVREAARFKFGLIFVATAALSPVFLRHTGWWLFGIGGLYLLAAAVGLFGLWQHRAAVEWAFLLMLLGVLWIAAVFNFIPRESLMSVLAGS